MQKLGKNTLPHEPLQPLVDVAETLEDVQRYEELVREIHERRQKARRRLYEAGIKVLGLDEQEEHSTVPA